MPKNSILLVEDDKSLMAVMSHYLSKNDYKVLEFEDAKTACQRMPSLEFDLALIDMNLGELSGYDVLHSIKNNHPLVEVIIMTAYATVNDAVQTIKEGAYDYLTKPVKESDLILHINNALKKRELALENKQLKNKLKKYESLPQLIGNSKVMMDLRQIIQNVAQSEVGVLIQGESGTGKELVARSIHTLSNRKKGPFVAINCAAIPENLMESELFGHTKGSFTGANQDHQGKMAYSQGGILFLDEISELALPLQAKLLRALQEKEITPVGSNKSIPIDIRVISATNKDLQKEVEKKAFREDLYYRLNVYPIYVPALKERDGDIPLLLDYLAPDLRFSPEALELMELYSWPGNVRELENGLEYARINAKGAVIGLNHLPPIWKKRQTQIPWTGLNPDPSGKTETLAEMEKKVIIKTLNDLNGNQSKCAQTLGITRSRLLYKMKKLNIQIKKITE